MDCVAHCGDANCGSYVNSLVLTDPPQRLDRGCTAGGSRECGYLPDHFGRKPVMRLGLGLHLFATFPWPRLGASAAALILGAAASTWVRESAPSLADNRDLHTRA
jgi:hypothetical protein